MHKPTGSAGMNRRSFVGSLLVTGGGLMLGRSALAQSLAVAGTPPTPSPAQQSETIRAAAHGFLQALAPDRRGRLTFPYPKGQKPAAVSFDELGRGPGHWGKPKPGTHDLSFDIEGHPIIRDRSDGGRPGGPGGPKGPGGPDGPGGPGGPQGPRDPAGGRPAAGERLGQAVWTNFPVDNVPRPGVQMGEFTAAERSAAHGLLQAVLSPMGYQKVLDVMAADQRVADAGPDYAAGLDVYTLGLFGQPSAAAPWMLQFGGHHLGLNVTFVGDRAVCSPLHTGILPARFESAGKVVRGLGRENDKAFDLLATFNDAQRKAATIDHDVSDLVFGPGRPDAKLSPEGVRASDLSEGQQAVLLSLVGEWAGVLNTAHAAAWIDELRRLLPETRFAWSGPTTREPGQEGGAYFRVHGPSLLIEHAPQGNQGGYKVHVHTVMRNLGNDYAAQLV